MTIFEFILGRNDVQTRIHGMPTADKVRPAAISYAWLSMAYVALKYHLEKRVMCWFDTLGKA